VQLRYPAVRVKSYEELNAWLLDKCIASARTSKHPELTDKTVWQVFQEERPHLVPYAGRFDGFHSLPAAVSKTCLVRFDNNKYSVAATAVGRQVEIRAYAERIEIRQEGRLVGDHPRHFGRDRTVYNPWHYVPVLLRKPGALRNGAPFKDWVLPGALEQIRRKLQGSSDGDRQMVKVLGAVLTEGMPAVKRHVPKPLARRPFRRCNPQYPIPQARSGTATASADLSGLALTHEPVADCARYDLLRRAWLMDRAEIMAAMGELKLYGMRAAYDELMAVAVRRQHEPRQIVGDLLAAEINEKKARSVKYQITTAKLPYAREIEEFTFDDTPINETLVRDLASGEFLSQQRNVVLVGGTGTGKTHISVAIARAVIRNGARGRFFNVVDLVNRLEAEARAGRAGRLGRTSDAARLRHPR
jgi:hypothetical protein